MTENTNEIKRLRLELLAVQIWLREILEDHRRKSFLTCPDDCWCWEVGQKASAIEQALKEESNDQG